VTIKVVLHEKMSVEIKDCVFGKGVFAVRSFEPDELIWNLGGEPVNEPTRTTIYIGNGEHVDDPYGIYFNHSFEPNCKIQGRSVFALKDIEKNTHLTFNYLENEPTISTPFQVNGGRWVQ